MLTKWLDEIEKRANSLPEGYPRPTTGKVKEGEVVLGTVPSSLWNLWGVVQQFQDEANSVHAAHREKCHAPGMSADRSECENNSRRVGLLREQMEVVRKVFLCSLVNALGIDELNIVLRENWTVAKSPEEAEPKLAGITIVELPMGAMADILGGSGRDRVTDVPASGSGRGGR